MASPSTFWADAKKGLTLPWTLTASIVIGVLLMLTRILFGTEGGMANSDHVVGALVITVAIIATAEVARALRLINVAFGAWLVAAPFLLDGVGHLGAVARSEEHTSELQSLMRISYAVFCLKKKNTTKS